MPTPEPASPNPYNMDQYTEKTGPSGAMTCPPGYVLSVFGTCEVPSSDPWQEGHVGGGLGRYIGSHIAGFAGHQPAGGTLPPRIAAGLEALSGQAGSVGAPKISEQGTFAQQLEQANKVLTANFFKGGHTGTRYADTYKGLRAGPEPPLTEAEQAQIAEGLNALHEHARRSGELIEKVQQNIKEAGFNGGVVEFAEEAEEEEEEECEVDWTGKKRNKKTGELCEEGGVEPGELGDELGERLPRRAPPSRREASQRAVEGFLGGRPNLLRENMGLSRRRRRGALKHLNPRGRF